MDNRGILREGEQQMLAVARALVGSPELILMDEVTEGLSQIVVKSIEEQLLRLKEMEVGILLSAGRHIRDEANGSFASKDNLKAAKSMKIKDVCFSKKRGL